MNSLLSLRTCLRREDISARRELLLRSRGTFDDPANLVPQGGTPCRRSGTGGLDLATGTKQRLCLFAGGDPAGSQTPLRQ